MLPPPHPAMTPNNMTAAKRSNVPDLLPRRLLQKGNRHSPKTGTASGKRRSNAAGCVSAVLTATVKFTTEPFDTLRDEGVNVQRA